METNGNLTASEPAPVISVVIVEDYAVKSDKSRAQLREVLTAVAQQDFSEPAEFILIEFADDCADRADELRRILPSLKLIRGRSDNSYGLKNEVVAAARSEYVAMLDADCRPDPDWLGLVAGGLRKRPDAAAVSGRTEYPRTTFLGRAVRGGN